MIVGTVFERWGESIRTAWQTADWIIFWGWVLMIVGIACVFLIIIFTQFKRKERDSIKFTSITTVIAGILLGFGFHMVLVGNGL